MGSSAYLMMELVSRKVTGRDSRGLRTHPWGTPELRVSVEEVLLLFLTHCGLPVKKFRIQRVLSRAGALSLM
jgi:hypothetical protein